MSGGRFGKLLNSRLFRFCVIGFSNFLIITVTVFVMMSGFSIDSRVTNICAYTLANISSFYWNKRWVFKSKGGNVWQEIFWFLVAYLCAVGLQFAFFTMLISWLDVNEYLAQFLGMFVFGTVNFLMNKFVTFKTTLE